MCKRGLVAPLPPEEIASDFCRALELDYAKPAWLLSRLVSPYARGGLVAPLPLETTPSDLLRHRSFLKTVCFVELVELVRLVVVAPIGL